ncbi:N12 class adenine-specific DNA methylase [Sinomonas atrocyanea]|uniref:helicase-related protein n=1 Tax=Sinomonas atrocyanea TaxID=37927 RepID=UPI002784F3DF|nr:helicase-related protein [Sinomonas atrocyanea]MDP9886087.1 N12 class adenine-specific DNA methylase [Sinomonas atrocyanea]
MARWGSWGAQGVWQIFDEDRPEHAAQRQELKELLSEREYLAAKRTTINAHYTDAAYAQAVWGTLARLGFTEGEVLEPGSGPGTFIGLAPEGARMTGVELDPVTAGIAQKLYPHAEVRNESFAATRYRAGHFDAVVGNVPFADLVLHDPRHNAGGHSMHNHFIIKSLALTRPGGAVAVLTSSFTLDAGNPAARREMNAMADLIGAVRLPTGAHRRAAGTEALTDLLVFRRREPGQEPASTLWETVHAKRIDGQTTRVNAYFDEHPEHLLGDLHVGHGMYGEATLTLTTPDLAAVPARLEEALTGITDRALAKGRGMTARTAEQTAQRAAWVPAERGLWEGHLTRTDTGFTVVQDGAHIDFPVPGITAGPGGARVKAGSQAEELTALLGIRDAARTLLELEAADVDDTPETDAARELLRTQYRGYTAAFGPVNRFKLTPTGRVDEDGEPIMSRRVPLAVAKFRQDPWQPVVMALEEYDESTGTAKEAPLLAARQVAPRRPVLGAETAEDALAITLDTTGEVDLATIAHLLATDEADARARLGEAVYEDPKTGELQTRAAYLSGNVRAKLREAEAAAEADERFAGNVSALRAVQPEPLRMDEVEARIGAVWISPADHQAFLQEILADPRASVVGTASMWDVKAGRHSLLATSEWGTGRMPASDIFAQLLEQRSVRVTEEVDGRRVLNQVETAAAQEKAQALQERFSEWVWEKPDRATRLIGEYNDRFNAIVLRDYTAEGEALTLPGLAKDFVPRPHQRAAVARMVAEPAVGLFHQVGAGKTAEMVMGVMELKRLGLANKPAVVVPNHMLEQFGREWLQLYPQARILAASIDDLAKDRRRRFVARAAANDWDAVIMTRTAFERLPLTSEAAAAYLDAEVSRLRAELEAVKAQQAQGPGMAGAGLVKRMEKRVLAREEDIKALLDKPTDPGLSFEQSGIDYLVVDELHDYKNLDTPSNIPGAAIQGSKRASDLHMKAEYLRAREGRRVITGATATPIANSVTEMYVMQRYLRPDLLEDAGIADFNTWAATFGQVVEEMELSVAGGDRFKLKARFAKFQNVPELLRMFHTFADVKTAEDLKLPVPDLAERAGDGQRAPELHPVEPTPELSEYIQRIGERVDAIEARMVEPTEDNMLKVSTDGRKAALDMRLVDPVLEPFGETKASAAAALLARVYAENKDAVYTDPATGEPEPVPGALQIVFCDQGTPGDGWNVYDELKRQLVVRGVPGHMVRFMHEARNDSEKARLFADARAGHIAVLVGSTQKMGVGTNIQKRAIHLVDMDAPWRPADVEQRHGRIIRQGNQNPEVRISQFVTVASFDSFMWQGLERKSRFINAIMKGRLDVREIEDIGDNTLSFAQAKAITSGNPLVLEKANADQEYNRLSRLERAHHRNLVAVEHTRSAERTALEAAQADLPLIEPAVERAVDTSGEAFAMTVRGARFTSRTEAAAAVQGWAAANSHHVMNPYARTDLGVLAEVGGHAVRARLVAPFPGQKPTAELSLDGVPRTSFELDRDALVNADLGTIRQLENRVAGLPRLAQRTAERAAEAEGKIAEAEAMLDRPFKHVEALAAARAEVERVDAAIAARSGPAEPAGAAEPDGLDEETRALAGLVAVTFPRAARGGGGRSGDEEKGYTPAQRRDLGRGR